MFKDCFKKLLLRRYLWISFNAVFHKFVERNRFHGVVVKALDSLFNVHGFDSRGGGENTSICIKFYVGVRLPGNVN